MVQSIFFSDKGIDQHKKLTDVLNLKDLIIVGQEFDEFDDRQYLLCIPKYEFSICLCCGGLCNEVHDYPKQRRIHDTPLGGRPTCLIFDSRRFKCPHCESVFTQRIRDVVPDCTYTYRLAEEIAAPNRKQDISTLSLTYRLGYKLVESILFKAAELKLSQRNENPVEVKSLGIDEISQRKGNGSYVLVLTDLDRRVLLDILPDRGKEGLMEWLRTPPAGIDLSKLENAATDLWSHYRNAVQSVYPKVSVVADRFHVVQNLQEAIHEARRQAQNDAETKADKQLLKGLRYLLLKNRHNLNQKDKKRLEELKQSHPHLYQLWELRQRLYEWYETHTSPEFARITLLQWIQDARKLPFSSLHNFCNTLTNWLPQILNFFNNRITSGFVEGMNSKIRLLKRIAFGIPNFEHFRLRMLWACA